MSNPINYVKCIDPLSKRSYYYNCITHDAQWNCPKGLKEKVDDVSLPKDDNTICNYVVLCLFHNPLVCACCEKLLENG